MVKDRVNINIRILSNNSYTDRWCLYRRLNNTYAVDVDNEDGTSSIYPISDVQFNLLNSNEWILLENNIDYIKKELRYVDTKQLIYF